MTPTKVSRISCYGSNHQLKSLPNNTFFVNEKVPQVLETITNDPKDIEIEKDLVNDNQPDLNVINQAKLAIILNSFNKNLIVNPHEDKRVWSNDSNKLEPPWPIKIKKNKFNQSKIKKFEYF